MAQKIFNYKAIQISIHTMKYENTNYISFGSLPWIILPIIALTALITLFLSGTFYAKSADLYAKQRTDSIADSEDLPVYPPEFQIGDEAFFNFTGDTVLVLSQQDVLTEDEVRVLFKTAQGSFQTVDLPDKWLVKVNADTIPAKPPAPMNDKLEQYKKAGAK